MFSLNRWIRQTFGKSRGPGTKQLPLRRSQGRLRVEVLEDRSVPSITLLSEQDPTLPGSGANGGSQEPSVSADGRVVAFSSVASNLVPGDTNGAGDVFVKNLQTGAITRVSAAADGTQGDSESLYPSVSADGRYVAFVSDATNLVLGDTNGIPDIFLWSNPNPTDIALSNTTVAENQPAGTTVGTLTATDLDSASFTYTLVGGAGSADNAAFAIAGDELRTAGPLNYEAGATRSVRVRVTDSTGNWYEESFTITITNAHETHTWLGGSATNGNWTRGENWAGGYAPSPGEDLLFPAGAARLSNTNDFTADTPFDSIRFTGGGYSITGNSIYLGGGISYEVPGGDYDNLYFPITLTAAQTFSTLGAFGNGVQFFGALDLNGHTLTVNANSVQLLRGDQRER